MRIVEYRIILPTNVPQYQIGNLYMCCQRTRETQGGGEGIEIVTNEPYEEDGEKGQYTHKIMHFKSKIPAFIRWAIPDKYCHLHEKSHNSYPHFHTLYENPGLGKDFYLLVESQHIVYDKAKGCPDNVLGLTEEELKIRKVMYLDIVNGKPGPEKKEWNMVGFQCPEAGVNQPLTAPKKTRNEDKPPEWVENYDGELMICVKVVKLLFKWRGLQNAVEKYALNTTFHDVFLDSHRALMSWAKEWYPMNLEQIRAMERELEEEQRRMEFEKIEEEEMKSMKKKDKKDKKKGKDKSDKRDK